MSTLLEDFWYGNIEPQEQSSTNSPEVNKLFSLMDRNREKLCETMTDAQKALLEKYDDAIGELHDATTRDVFMYAFRLGGQMMLEMIKKQKDF